MAAELSPDVRVHVVPEGTRATRVDKLLAAVWTDLSRSAIQRAIEAGTVLLAGVPVRAKQEVGAGARLELSVPRVVPTDLTPLSVKLDVLFEDEHLLVVNKPAGMVVHPGAGTGPDTLVHALLAHCRGSLSGIGGVERPGIVHRLDRDTSGAILVAKSDAAHVKLARAFQDRKVRKVYGVLVKGDPVGDSGVFDGAIGRHGTQRHRMAVVKSGGREALTEWRLVARYGGEYAWLLCDIKTGRTHQIRVHCQHARLPVLGDTTYGWKGDDRLVPPPSRFMLHAREVEVRHPITGARLLCTAPWPADFEAEAARLLRLFGSATPGAGAPSRRKVKRQPKPAR